MEDHAPDTEPLMVILSGQNSKLDSASRYTRMPFHGTEGQKTPGSWYTTLLNAYGNPLEHDGDLDVTMQRNRLNQTGVIDQFLTRAVWPKACRRMCGLLVHWLPCL